MIVLEVYFFSMVLYMEILLCLYVLGVSNQNRTHFLVFLFSLKDAYQETVVLH